MVVETTEHGPTGETAVASGWKHFALAERTARFGYWRTSFADGKMFWSEGMYRLLGVIPQEREPSTGWLIDQIHPEDVRQVGQKIEAAIRNRSPFAYRTRAKSPAATAQIVDTVGEVELDESGMVIAVVGVCTDVTAQVTAEAEREAAQERYRLMADEASDVIMLHVNDRVDCVSSALKRLLGREPEELQHGRYLSLVHPDDMKEARKVLGRPSPGEIRTAVYRLRHADGHYVWFETSTRGIYDEATGEFRKEIAVGRDVSERKAQELQMRAAQERAESANRAKSLFLANMSHELRTPLNAIMGFVDMMRQRVFGALGDPHYENYAEEIHKSAKLLLDRISDVLEVARIEAGMLELSREPLDLADTVAACAAEVSGSIRERGLSLSTDVAPEGLVVAGDRHALRQILMQLLSNAIKYTPAGGSIRVEARRSAACTIVSVSDTGIGIPQGELTRLCRPFEQVCAERYLAKQGQGLGLALVRALAEKHGGTVRIDSAEGKGTSVHVELPAQAVRAAA